MKLSDLRTTTALPVTFTHGGLTYTLYDNHSGICPYRIDCDEWHLDYPAESLADVREMVRTHSAAWKELNSEPLVITQERKGQTRVISRQAFDTFDQARDSLKYIASRARSGGFTVYTSQDWTVARVDTTGAHTYYRVEPASTYARKPL